MVVNIYSNKKYIYSDATIQRVIGFMCNFENYVYVIL